MGHIVNPISVRLAKYNFWSSKWVSNLHYSYFLTRDLIYNKFLMDYLNNFLIKKDNFLSSKFFMFSHVSIHRCKKKLYVFCYSFFSMPSDIPLLWFFFERLFYLWGLRVHSKRYRGFGYFKYYKFLYKLFKVYFFFNFYLYQIQIKKFFEFFFKKKLLYFNLGNINSLNVKVTSLKSKITAQLIANYIARALERRYSLSRVIYPILKLVKYSYRFRRQYLKRNRYYKDSLRYPIIKGIRISYGGRYRKQRRVSVTKFDFGSVPLNTFSVKVGYGFSLARTRFGVGGVKVWMC